MREGAGGRKPAAARMDDHTPDDTGTAPESGARGARGPTDAVRKTDREWAEQLTPEQFAVTRKKGTERAFTGAYWNSKTPGVYRCVCCGSELFRSEDKFDSGTGWPSFTAPAASGQVATASDHSHFMRRTEVLCRRCDAHLGHLFDDGPRPTGQRYCINSAALTLDPKE